MPKLKFSVIVTQACAADMEAEVLLGMWNTRMWFPPLVGHMRCFHMRWPGVSSDTCCTWRNKPCRGCCQWWPGNIQGGVVPHPANEGGLTAGPEGAKAVAGTRVRSEGIHDYVGVVHRPNEELHEEPAWPVVVASLLVQACNLVVLVHGLHVPATRGKVGVPGAELSCKLCEESWELTYLV